MTTRIPDSVQGHDKRGWGGDGTGAWQAPGQRKAPVRLKSTGASDRQDEVLRDQLALP